MNFHSCEKEIFKSFGCTKICKDLKMNQNEPKRSNATHNQQQFTNNFSLPCPQIGGFDNSFINGRGFIYFSISKISFTF